MSLVAGSIPRSSTQKLSERISALDFGATGNGTTDDTAAINAAIAYCASKGKALAFPAKTYRVSNLAPLTVPGTILIGEPGARIKFTGAGAGITIDGSAPANLGNGIRIIIRDLILDGNPSLTYCIDALALVGGELKNVRCTNCVTAGVLLRRLGVSNLIDTLIVSHNIEAFVTTPVSGIILAQDCGGNTLLNVRMEGVSGPGIDIAGAVTTTILGGTSEGNGTGLIIRAGQSLTTVVCLHCEANANFDFDITGYQNDFYNCAASSANSVKLRSGSSANHFYNGFYNAIVLDAGSQFNVFDLTCIAAAIVDNGYHTVFQNVLDIVNTVNIRNKQWADQTFNGVVGFNGPVSVVTPTAVTPLYVATANNSDPSLVHQARCTAEFAVNSGAPTALAITHQIGAPYTVSAQVRNASADGSAYPLALNPLGGNVAIGTANPQYKLDVAGDINCTGTFRVGGVAIGSGGAQTPWTGDVDAAGHNLLNAKGLYLSTGQPKSASSYSEIRMSSNDASNPMTATWTLQTGANPRLSMFAVEPGVAYRNVCFAESGGNVGIGTATPGYLLDVAGAANISGVLRLPGAGNYATDAAAAAAGVPLGGLYHNAGVLRVRIT